MTVIDSRTGEVLDALQAEAAPILSATEARALTDRIRQTLTVGHDLIVEAFKGRAWTALGYETWDAYCAGEFAEARMVRLDREQRREIVAEMREAGMSGRAIASATGVHESTVRDDLRGAGNPAPVPVIGTDGKTYPSSAKNGTPMPAATIPDRSREAVEARVSRAREMAAANYTSRQITEALGITQEGCANLLRREGIQVPADAVVGKTKRHDPNRAVEQLVMALEDVAFGVNNINFAGLDPARIAGWSGSLRESLQSLNRLTRLLKELDQP